MAVAPTSQEPAGTASGPQWPLFGRSCTRWHSVVGLRAQQGQRRVSRMPSPCHVCVPVRKRWPGTFRAGQGPSELSGLPWSVRVAEMEGAQGTPVSGAGGGSDSSCSSAGSEAQCRPLFVKSLLSVEKVKFGNGFKKKK